MAETSEIGQNWRLQEEGRTDVEEYCLLHQSYKLIVNGVCFSRQRCAKCQNCVFDQNPILPKLVWHLCDWIEDMTEKQRRPCET